MNEIVWAMRGEPELLEDFVLHLRSLAGELLGDAGMELDFCRKALYRTSCFQPSTVILST